MAERIRRADVGDLALAVLVAALLIGQVATHGVSGPIWVAVVGGIALAVGLVWRRRAPWSAWAITFVANSTTGALGLSQQANYAIVVAGFVAMYTIAGRAGWPGTIAAFMVGLGLVLVAAIPSGGVLKSSFAAFVLAGAVVIGRVVGAYRRLASELQVTVAELDARRAEIVETAIADEKVKIARELHDVIAHSVSVMVIQASAAEGLLEMTPERARGPLIAVQESGRQALGELRRLLAVLRPGPSSTPTLSPQPGLADLPEIVATLRQVAISVDLRVEGDSGPLPPGVDLAAYRIVQEALTNVVKHADADAVSVTIRHCPGYVDINITDNGRGLPAEAIQGHGLLGMRERVAAYEGELTAGPSDAGGFAVAARLTVSHDQ